MPYLAILFFYSLDVSYLTDEVEKGGNIVEFDPPEDTRDLSDVTLFQSCVFVCGFPCIVMIQFLDLFKAVRKTYSRVYGGKSLLSCECLHKKTQVANSNVAKEEAKKKAKGSTLWKRLWKTCIRCFRGSRLIAIKIKYYHNNINFIHFLPGLTKRHWFSPLLKNLSFLLRN